MSQILLDLRHAARALRRNPGFAACAALTLALGIGAGTAIWSVVSAVLLRPLPLPEADRLALVWNRSEANGETWLSLPEVEDLRERCRAFAGVAALRDRRFNVTGEGEPEEVPAVAVSANLFPLVGVSPAFGRSFLPAEDRAGAERVAVLSHGFWRRRFGGDPKAVGRSVRLDGAAHRIVGVLPEGFRVLPPSSVFPATVDVWVPLEPGLNDLLRRRDVHHLHALARLTPGATTAAAQAELDGVARSLRQEHPELYAEPGWGLSAVPFREQIVRRARPALLVLLGAAGLLLLLVCANVAGLLLARHGARRQELAIRAALGAGRARLVRQLTAEGLLLSLFGGAAGVWLAALGVDLLPALSPGAPGGVPRLDEVAIDGRVLGVALAAALATALLVGVGPALAAAGEAIAGPAREGGTGTRRAGRARRLLVVAEIALALVLAAGTGLLAKSYLQLAEAPAGFRPTDVLTLRLTLPFDIYPTGEQRADFLAELARRVESLPGVRAAGAVSHLPLSGAHLGSGFAAAEGSGEVLDADLRGVTPGYFRTMGIALLGGRELTAADGPDTPQVAVVDETLAARLWPGQSPLGKRLRWIRSDVPIEVVGVVRAVRHEGLGTTARETVYRPYRQYANATSVFLAVQAATAPEVLAAAVAREVRELDPDQPVADVMSMADRVGASLGQPRFQALLLGLFAGLALALAAIGIYGVISYAVTRRTRELGIRLALGAARRDLLGLVLGEGMALAAAGVAAGLALAWAATRLLAGLLYGVAATDPQTFVGVALLLAAVALLACWLPARRAMRIDPAATLKET